MTNGNKFKNAEYKKPITKNGISNKSIIYKASKEIQEDLNKLRELNEPTPKNDFGVDNTPHTISFKEIMDKLNLTTGQLPTPD